MPLNQIIADVLKKPVDSVAVKNKFIEILDRLGTEFSILLDIPGKEMEGRIDDNIIAGIKAVREGGVDIEPGYDGEFGKVAIRIGDSSITEQQTLF